MSDTDSPLGMVVGPEERFGLSVVLVDVGQELSLEILGRGKDASLDAVPFELAEPQLHLVEPGAVRWALPTQDHPHHRRPSMRRSRKARFQCWTKRLTGGKVVMPGA